MGDKEYLVPQSRHEKYEMRPEDQECTVSCGVFENMCFAEFSMLYEYTTDTSEHTCWHSLDKTEDGIHVCDNVKDVIQTLFKDKKVKLNGWRWGKKEKPNTKPVLFRPGPVIRIRPTRTAASLKAVKENYRLQTAKRKIWSPPQDHTSEPSFSKRILCFSSSPLR